MKPYLLLSVLLVGCSPVVPNTPAKISDFLVQEEMPQGENREVKHTEKLSTSCEYAVINTVMDGDTVLLATREKVRIIGIDTPELDGPYTREEPYGKEASAYAKTLLRSGESYCFLKDRLTGNADKYDRLLRHIQLENGDDYGLKMVESGLAEYYRNGKYEHKAAYIAAESRAKAQRVGQWK